MDTCGLGPPCECAAEALRLILTEEQLTSVEEEWLQTGDVPDNVRQALADC